MYDLPPLEGVFLHWHTHGVTATTAGMHSLLARRKQLLGPTTLSGASIQLLYECATDSLRRLSLPGQDLHSVRGRAVLCMPVCSGMGKRSALPRRKRCFHQGCWYTRLSR